MTFSDGSNTPEYSGQWGGTYRSSFRASKAHQREQWIRYGLLSGGAPPGVDNISTRHYQEYGAENTEDLIRCLILLGFLAAAYSVSKYCTMRRRILNHTTQGWPRANQDARSRVPRFNVLERIDNWSPAKTYSCVMEEYWSKEKSVDQGIEMTRPDVTPDLEKNEDSEFVESGCAICFEEFSDSTMVRILPCNHIFHRTCLDTWFQRSPLCPLCMHDYSTDSITATNVNGAQNTSVFRRISTYILDHIHIQVSYPRFRS